MAVLAGLVGEARLSGAEIGPASGGQKGIESVSWWTSTEDRGMALERRDDLRWRVGAGVGDAPVGGWRIRVDDRVRHQEILGLGSSLEHSTCYNLSLLSPERRTAVLASLLDPARGIGMSLMRICMGTPDFTASPWYTYNDLPAGETDPEQARFSIEKDRAYVLPVLKEARRVRPDLKFFASPWSPPAWMKTSGRLGGGAINPEHFRAYALYFARFIEAYAAEGIPVHAVTVQNEPEYAPKTYPTCRWTADEQRRFIRDHLGPVFRARGIRTLIWCFDHNFDNPGYPAAILGDPAAAEFVDGAAFHHYVGTPSAMAALGRLFPAKGIYFTEGSVFGAEGSAKLATYLRHGARSYSAWVSFIDERRQPNPGPHPCSLTPVVLKRRGGRLEVEHRADYFLYGQFMRFIRPGAIRVESTDVARDAARAGRGSGERGAGSGDLVHVAVQDPGGDLVLVVANPAAGTRSIEVMWRDRALQLEVPAQSASTLRWRP